MSRRLIVGHFLKSAPIAATLMMSPAAHAMSVQAVFAAENALYGAGYTIGQADGWIDDQLRNAVKQYQSDHAGLTSSGELDAKTLDALGVSATSSQIVGGNTVASRAAALSELGLSEDRYQQSWTKVAAKPEPKPKPATEPVAAKAAKVASAPEPEIEKESEPDSKPVEIIASNEQTSQPEPKVATSEPVAEKKPEPKPVQSKPKVASVEPSPVPEEKPEVSVEAEPDSEPVKITSNFGFSDNSESGVAEVEVKADTPQAEVDATLASNSAEVEAALPQEPTAAGMASSTDSAATSEKPESSGNVLTKVFDFLFGWMV